LVDNQQIHNFVMKKTLTKKRKDNAI